MKGILSVINEFKKGSQYMVSCVCSLCSKDKEMYPDPFVIRKSHLKDGIIPCGCSSKPKISARQASLRIKRICKSKGYGYLGFHGVYKNAKSKFKFTCKYHGIQSKTFDSLTQGYGCIDCGKTNLLSQETAINTMISKINNDILYFNGFVGGVYKGNKTKVSILCNIHGLHETSSYDHISRNGGCCPRCNGKYQWSYKEKVNMSIEKCKSNNYKFIKLIDINSNNKLADMRIEYECKDGHYINQSFNNFFYKDTKCPVCNPCGYNKKEAGIFYVFEYKKENENMIYKFGITNRNSIIRGREHIQRIQSSIEINNLVFEFMFDDGSIPPMIEKYIHNNYETGVVDWLTSGNTETLIHNRVVLDEIIEYVKGLTK